MMRVRHIAGLDIGSGAVKLVLAEDNGSQLQIVGAVNVPTLGMRRGAVANPSSVTEAILKARSEIKRQTGVDVRSAYIGANDSRITTHTAKGLVAVSRADGQIAEDDIARSISAAEESLPRLQNRQILHQFPIQFRVDGDISVRDPLGMQGIKLEVEAIFVTAFLPHYKNLVDAVDGARITVDDIVASHLAAAQILLSKTQREIGVMLLNIGAETSEIAVWEEDVLLSLEVLPIGSSHIAQDIALGFQVSMETAERMKKSYVQLVEGGKKEIRLSGFDKSLEDNFSSRKLQDIVNARLGDIFELTTKHLKKIGRAGLLPAGVILTGGGANLAGIVDITKKELRLPTEIGEVTNLTGKANLVSGSEWSTALGLCRWGGTRERSDSPFRMSIPYSKKIKKFLQLLIP